MRAVPTLEAVNGSSYYQVYDGHADPVDNVSTNNISHTQATLHFSGSFSGTNAEAMWSRCNNANAYVAFTAEL